MPIQLWQWGVPNWTCRSNLLHACEWGLFLGSLKAKQIYVVELILTLWREHQFFDNVATRFVHEKNELNSRYTAALAWYKASDYSLHENCNYLFLESSKEVFYKYTYFWERTTTLWQGSFIALLQKEKKTDLAFYLQVPEYKTLLDDFIGCSRYSCRKR